MQKFEETPFVCIVLVAINIACFILCNMMQIFMLELGELDLQRILLNGEWWRIASSMFLHADIEHLFNNMVILFFLGAMIEKGVGHIPFGLIYLLSGIGGNVCSLIYKAMNGILVASVGASGAIFGLDGLLLAICFFSKRRDRFPYATPIRLLLVIGLSLYSGITATNIDNAAHAGGVLFGFIFGITYVLIDNIRKV